MILCQSNGGCMGCCGHDFGSAEEIKAAIDRNTAEFKKINDLKKFRDRADKSDLMKGVCRNVIKMGEKVFCPLHPSCNAGQDLRKDHCDTDYLCETAKKFKEWDKEIQESFLKFVSEKNLNVVEYGIKIDDGSLMKEFLEK